MQVEEMPLSDTAKAKLGALNVLERHAVDQGFEGFLNSQGEILIELSSTQRYEHGVRTFDLRVILAGDVVFVLCDYPKGGIAILDIVLVAPVAAVFH